MEYTKEFETKPTDSAIHMGSGSLEVLATPACIALAENTCLIMSEKIISDGQTTVGTHIEFNHLKASLIGETICVKATLLNQEKNKLFFDFSLYSGEILLGKGNHQRYIVNTSDFVKRLTHS